MANNEMSRLRQSWPWWRFVLTGLSALALTLSGYLGWHYVMGGALIGCNGGSSCDQVLSSRWSAVGGVLPVSGLAAGVYLAMLIASFSIGPHTAAPVRRLAWRAMLVLTGAAAGSAIWFTIVQKWIVGSFCPYCMSTHVIGVVLAILVIWRAPREFDDAATAHVRNAPAIAQRRVIVCLPAVGFASLGLALAGIVAACQVSITPAVVYRGGESQDNFPPLDPHAVPLVGPADAPYLVAMLFDYNCPHCQQLHFMLDEVVRRYHGKLAVALCPAPLNPQCNPYVPLKVDEFKDSCELAKIGLAVWVADRKAFRAFDNWMFSLESGDRWRPRSVDSARAKAIALVGQAKFDTALHDPWLGQYLQTSIRIYGHAGGHAVPKLVFGSRWVTARPNDVDDLVLVLHNSLGVPIP